MLASESIWSGTQAPTRKAQLARLEKVQKFRTALRRFCEGFGHGKRSIFLLLLRDVDLALALPLRQVHGQPLWSNRAHLLALRLWQREKKLHRKKHSVCSLILFAPGSAYQRRVSKEMKRAAQPQDRIFWSAKQKRWSAGRHWKMVKTFE